MTDHYLGQITVFPYNFAPAGWADCAGQLLPISQYTALFSLIGTYYGGNGTSNFALPDLQGRVPVRQGQLLGGSSYDIGEPGGQENVTLQANEIGTHNHTLGANTAHGSTNQPENAVLSTAHGPGVNGDRGLLYNATPPNIALLPGAVGVAGGNLPHNNVQPFLVLRYCIALNGVFPSRS
jgi:microcystin-dependent protein